MLEYDQLGTIKHRPLRLSERPSLHGSGVDDPLVWYDGGTVGAAGRRHLFANWQGSITAITDATGNVVQVNAYDAYGIPNATNLGRFQYTGQILIPEIGIYHYKARAYSPYLGRFLQTDPIGYDDQFNLYAYVGNDPVGRIDPSGLQAEKCMNCQGTTTAEVENGRPVGEQDDGGVKNAQAAAQNSNGSSSEGSGSQKEGIPFLNHVIDALDSFNSIFVGEIEEFVDNPSAENAGNIIVSKIIKPLKVLRPLKPSKVTVRFRDPKSLVRKPKTGKAQTVQRGRAETRREAEAARQGQRTNDRNTWKDRVADFFSDWLDF